MSLSSTLSSWRHRSYETVSTLPSSSPASAFRSSRLVLLPRALKRIVFLSTQDGISYMGVAASLRQDEIILRNPFLIDGEGTILNWSKNITFAGNNILWHLLQSVFRGLLQIDLVPANTQFTSTIPLAKRTQVKATKSLGVLNKFTLVDRNVNSAYGDNLFTNIPMREPVFENGTRIPTGLYKILGRALRVFGDPKLEEDYQSWLSPVIGFP